MKRFLRKTILFALVTALALATLPLMAASARSAQEPTPPPTGQISSEKLQQAWARQQRVYERLGRGFDRLDEFTARVQARIDKAKARGRDVTALQEALDSFVIAAKDAQPIYESAASLINSHQGFDENGKVTDLEEARKTVQALREKMQEIKSTMDGTGKALREAVKAFRQTNLRPQPTATP